MDREYSATLEKPDHAPALAKSVGEPAVPSLRRQTKAALDSELIDRTILRLNALCRRTTMDFALAVGGVVVDTLHSGNLELWRATGFKGVSFRALARHPDLPMSPAALCRSVAIYELSHRLEIRRWKRISTSHVRLVLPLEHAEQARLLELADAQSWSVSRLNEEVAQLPHNGPPSKKGGRTRGSRLRRTLKILARCISDLETLSTLEQEEISLETAQTLQDAIPRLRDFWRKLEVSATGSERAATSRHALDRLGARTYEASTPT
jgi:hypothetical protein